ncbi:META domain-containing protein [Pontibacter litorisediminis]|uniref:META domain-containing protein n=1 Tax=Pontibacter litorisediminis TaxID=1846260 RepID=UPI0023EAED54|nr:META domain-containing protein [Pontibacter litorisediminis]
MKKLLYILPALLLLLAGACTVQNKNQAAETDSVLDAYWALYSLEGQDVQRPQNTQTAFIRFEEGKTRVHGFTGCNRFFGRYELDGQNLKLSNLGSTRMACPDMDQENKLLDVLSRVDSYRIAGDLLTLYAGGTAVATFMSGTEESVTTPPAGGIIID